MNRLQQICCMLIFFATHLNSHESILSANSEISCTKQILRSYFPRPIVKAVLMKHELPKEKVELVATELSTIDKEIDNDIEAKIAKLKFNPLQNREEAGQIFRKTLYEAFAQILVKNQIEDPKEIQMYYEEIHMQKSKLFLECIQKNQER